MSNLNDDDLTVLFDELDELSKELEENVETSESKTLDEAEAEAEAEAIAESAKEIAKKALSKKKSKEVKDDLKADEESLEKLKTKEVTEKTPCIEIVDVAENKDARLKETLSQSHSSNSSIDVSKFNDETRLTDANLDNCMTNQSSLMAYYTAQSARSNAEVARAKLKFEVLEASLYSAYRKKLTDEGEKATEKSIENLVRLDARWQSAKEDVIQAQMISDIHTGFVHSLRDRKDMMIQKGSDRREEYKGKVRILGESELSEKASELGKAYLGK